MKFTKTIALALAAGVVSSAAFAQEAEGDLEFGAYAGTVLKNGYLSEKDVKGKKYYQIANGEISAGTVITLREVKIGDAVLRNVDASVVKSQKAPLLLGQSAMERFGTITIDNINNKLLIKH